MSCCICKRYIHAAWPSTVATPATFFASANKSHTYKRAHTRCHKRARTHTSARTHIIAHTHIHTRSNARARAHTHTHTHVRRSVMCDIGPLCDFARATASRSNWSNRHCASLPLDLDLLLTHDALAVLALFSVRPTFGGCFLGGCFLENERCFGIFLLQIQRGLFWRFFFFFFFFFLSRTSAVFPQHERQHDKRAIFRNVQIFHETARDSPTCATPPDHKC